MPTSSASGYLENERGLAGGCVQNGWGKPVQHEDGGRAGEKAENQTNPCVPI